MAPSVGDAVAVPYSGDALAHAVEIVIRRVRIAGTGRVDDDSAVLSGGATHPAGRGERGTGNRPSLVLGIVWLSCLGRTKTHEI